MANAPDSFRDAMQRKMKQMPKSIEELDSYLIYWHEIVEGEIIDHAPNLWNQIPKKLEEIDLWPSIPLPSPIIK